MVSNLHSGSLTTVDLAAQFYGFFLQIYISADYLLHLIDRFVDLIGAKAFKKNRRSFRSFRGR